MERCLLWCACGIGELAAHLRALLQPVGDAGDIDDLPAGELERPAVHPTDELQREHPHTDEVRAVDAREALDDHGLYAEQTRALGCPVARRAGAVLFAAQDDQWYARGLIAPRRGGDRPLPPPRVGEPAEKGPCRARGGQYWYIRVEACA